MAASSSGRVRVLEIFGVFAALGLIGLYLKKKYWRSKKDEGNHMPRAFCYAAERA